MKRSLYVFLFLIALIALYHNVFKPNFSVDKMLVDCKEGMDCWEGKPLSEEEQKFLTSILNQKFYYLDKGNQSYVFKSADDSYVLKFFHFERMRPSALWQYLETIPFIESYTDRHRESCDKRFRRATTGYSVAYKYDRENTGLLFMRLGCIPHIPYTVTLHDQWGTATTVELDNTYFTIQKLAIPSNTYFSKLLDKGDVAGVKQAIDQLFSLYLDEYKKGVYDFDHNLMHNTGFLPDRAIRMDIGKLQYMESIKKPEIFLADLKSVVQRIDDWLGRHYRSYQKELNLYMQQQLEKIFYEENTHKESTHV